MTKKALLISGQESETISTLARNLIHAGGLSLFARQMKQMKAIGVDEMHVVTDWFIRDFEAEILKTSDRPERVYLHATRDAPVRLLDHNMDGDSWFLLEEGVILDRRIIEQVADHPAPTAISFIGQNEFLSAHTAHGIALHFEDHDGFFGSVAKISGATFGANIRKLNSLDGLANALKAIARAADCEIVAVTGVPLYLADRQREVDLVWFPLISREDGDRGTEILLEFYRKDMPDWPTRLLYRHIENFLVKYLCKCPVRPLYVSIVTTLAALYVIWLFWSGYMIAGLSGAYIVSILYGVRDKLVRLKMRRQKIMSRKIQPQIIRWSARPCENLVEYGWYGAIGGYLSTLYGPAPLIIAAALILFRLADKIQTGFFRRMTNRHISTIAGFDRKFQLIAGGRNTLLWALLPFTLFDLSYGGFGFICVYAVITFFVHQARLVYHLENLMIANSRIFADNFEKTRSL